MSDAKLLTFYLEPPLLHRAEAGNVNFINKIASAIAPAGYRVAFLENTSLELVQSAAREGYSMFHMDDPFHDRALTMRKTYYFPFWHIENSPRRWEWPVAKLAFDQDSIDPDVAGQFFQQWQQRLFDDGPEKATRGDFIYMPLQGKLREKRSFQACSPLGMILEMQSAEPDRDIVLTLHPNETYSTVEMDALMRLVDQHDRITISDQPRSTLVRDCNYVVTQNSSVALDGYFHRKPAILFGQIDFHHIAANVQRVGVENAVAAMRGPEPDFARYVFWFLQQQAINAGRPDVEDRVLKALRNHGWWV